MSTVKRSKTTFEVKFIGQDAAKLELSKRIQKVQVHSELGKSSSLVLDLALKHDQIKKISLESLPKGIHVLWERKTYFKGEATQIQITGQNTVQVVYQDPLHRFDKMFSETQTKQQRLKSFIEKLVNDLKERPSIKFYSSHLFDEELPTFSLGYRSIREILDELASFYGFTFFIRPDQSEANPSLCFLRTGQAMNSQPLSVLLKDLVSKPVTTHSVQWKYGTVTVGLADGMNENQKKPLRADALKDPFRIFKAGEEMKRRFEIELPELDIPVSHPDLYSRAERILPYQYSHKNMLVDTKLFVSLEPKLQVGDCIQIQGALPEYQNGSNYLVHSTLLAIESSQPKLTIKAIRP